MAETGTPRGRIRLACPMSFGIAYVAPVLPGFLSAFPQVSIALHLVGPPGGLRPARVTALVDSRARRLASMPWSETAPSRS